MARPPNLPDFERPPVVEVAVGAQFERIAGFTNAHLGMFFERVRATYPKVADQPRLPPLDFDLSRLGGGQPVFFQLGADALGERMWFVNEADDKLVQLQSDRLICNWRGSGEAYPRFESLEESYVEAARVLGQLCASEALEVPKCKGVEVTYVNRIAHTTLDGFLRGAGAAETSQVRSPIRQQRVEVRPIADADGQLTIQLACPADESHSMMQLVATLPTARPDLERAVDEMRVARNAIVVTFAEMTTESVHEEWGRRQ